MKKHYTLFLFCLSFAAFGQSSSYFINQESLDARGNTMLLGSCSKVALMRFPYNQWYDRFYNDYAVDTVTTQSFKADTKDIEVLIFAATWCGDTQQNLPRFLKILEKAEVPNAKIKMVMVDNAQGRYKQSPAHEEASRNIFRVPTFIILQKGIEIGRIIERPVESLEKDLAKIITHQTYKPAYRAQARVAHIVNTYPTKHIAQQLQFISNEVKPLLRNSSELNAYGYILLGQKRYLQAIAVLEFNTNVYPQEANTFDSLAEAYLIAGDKKTALYYYEKALMIDGNLVSAREMVGRLGK
jgi:tetratricopeptide (TPR) repeat protein